MTRFDRALDQLRVHEGGYVNHPKDPGRATNKGITQRVYDAYLRRRKELPRSVRHITETEARSIYLSQYWRTIRGNDLPEGVAYVVFDAAVNSGVSRAVRWLQKVVGARVDGIVGEETLGLAEAMEPKSLIDAYCDRRLAFMKRARHPETGERLWPTFGGGWSARVSEVRARGKKWAEGRSTPPVSAPEAGKAEGYTPPEPKEVAKDGGVWGVLTGLFGTVGALAGLEGPLAWGASAVLVIVALMGVWMLLREARE